MTCRTQPQLPQPASARALDAGAVARPAIFLGRARFANLCSCLYSRYATSTTETAAAVESHPHIADRLLSVANTVRHGAGISATSLEAACMRLGNDRAKALSVAFEVGRILNALYGDALDFAAYWRACLIRGCVARAIAMNCDPRLAGEAMLAALVQDIGMAPLAAVDPAAYGELQSRCGGHVELPIAEWQRYRINHVHVGVKLALGWNLPDRIVVAVGRHHTNPPLGRIAEPQMRLWQLCYAAGLWPVDSRNDAAAGPLRRMLSGTFGIEPASFGRLLSQARGEYEDVERFFDAYLPASGGADVMWFAARQLANSAPGDSQSQDIAPPADRLLSVLVS